jgi:hypothetical protein
VVHVNASGIVHRLISNVIDTIQQEKKEKDIQMNINRIAAYGFLSEGYSDYRLKPKQQNGTLTS